tara:strand:- start:211 stop:366 length:156 start_codon:yes stop_codon:yes gene_type:complete
MGMSMAELKLKGYILTKWDKSVALTIVDKQKLPLLVFENEIYLITKERKQR